VKGKTLLLADFAEIQRDPVPAICLAGSCAWVSGALILRIWTVHRSASRTKKVFWTLAVLVPVIGWTFYGAFFQLPPLHRDPDSPRNDDLPDAADYYDPFDGHPH
jgi:hypothetical protein